MSGEPPGTVLSTSDDAAILVGANGYPEMVRKSDLPAAQQRVADVALSTPREPARGAAVTLAEAAELLGMTPDDAADELTRHTLPRVVCWPRRDVEELAQRRGRSA